MLKYNTPYINVELREKLAVTCWPTLVVVGPSGLLLYYLIGEGHYFGTGIICAVCRTILQYIIESRASWILFEQGKQPLPTRK